MADIVAAAEVDIAAPAGDVWRALTDPDLIAQYFFGTRVSTDWHPGSSITWSGEYQGKSYEDHGTVVDAEPNKLLRVTHFSPLSGLTDEPHNYHTLTYVLEQRDGATHLSLTQDRNATDEEAEHSRRNWEVVFTSLKELLEKRDASVR